MHKPPGFSFMRIEKSHTKRGPKIRGHAVAPDLRFHSGGGNADVANKVSFYQMSMFDIKQFLAADPSKVNKYILYNLMVKLDTELRTAVSMISYTVANSYMGPSIKEPPKEFDKSTKFIPSRPSFLKDVEVILGEIEFSTLLPSLVRMLVRDGDTYYRIYRKSAKEIQSLELLPAGAVTIMDNEFKLNPIDAGYVIRSPDVYLLNEFLGDKKTGGVTAGVNVNQQITNNQGVAGTVYSKTPSQSSLGSPEGKLSSVAGSGAVAMYEGDALTVIDPEEVIHFAYQREGSACKDILGRNTFSIYGESPLESLVFVLKLKMAVTLDYMLYSRTGLPRWDFAVELSEIMNLENYSGDYQTRLKEARTIAKEIFNDFEKQLYYVDEDQNSPTVGSTIPMEADHAFIHGSDVTVEQKGGRPASVQYLEVIKKCDMSICSALGVPLSLFGYETGATYAIGYITRSFMLSFGGGLLRSIGTDILRFLKREFKKRNFQSEPEDWEHLELSYYIDDSEAIALESELEKARLNIAVQGYVNGLLNKNEGRARIGYDEVEGGEEFRDVPALNNPNNPASNGQGQPPVGSETGGLNPEGAANPNDGGDNAGMQKNQAAAKLPLHRHEGPVTDPFALTSSQPLARGSSELPEREPGAEKRVRTLYAEALAELMKDLASELDKLPEE